MTLATILQWLGGLLAYVALSIILYGIWRGTRRPAGLTTGPNGSWLQSPWFYLITSTLFFGISYVGSIPLPWTVSSSTRVGMLIFGALLYFPGILLVLWARLTSWKKLFRFHGFRRAIVQEPPTRHKRTVCHHTASDVCRLDPRRLWEPAALSHLDNPVVCLFRPFHHYPCTP